MVLTTTRWLVHVVSVVHVQHQHLFKPTRVDMCSATFVLKHYHVQASTIVDIYVRHAMLSFNHHALGRRRSQSKRNRRILQAGSGNATDVQFVLFKNHELYEYRN